MPQVFQAGLEVAAALLALAALVLAWGQQAKETAAALGRLRVAAVVVVAVALVLPRRPLQTVVAAASLFLVPSAALPLVTLEAVAAAR